MLDERSWLVAMKAIKDSAQFVASKTDIGEAFLDATGDGVYDGLGPSATFESSSSSSSSSSSAAAASSTTAVVVPTIAAAVATGLGGAGVPDLNAAGVTAATAAISAHAPSDATAGGPQRAGAAPASLTSSAASGTIITPPPGAGAGLAALGASRMPHALIRPAESAANPSRDTGSGFESGAERPSS